MGQRDRAWRRWRREVAMVRRLRIMSFMGWYGNRSLIADWRMDCRNCRWQFYCLTHKQSEYWWRRDGIDCTKRTIIPGKYNKFNLSCNCYSCSDKDDRKGEKKIIYKQLKNDLKEYYGEKR